MSQSLAKRLLLKLFELQHLLIILLVSFLIITSGWLLMGRALRANASLWDYSHVYLGLLTAALSVSFLASNCIRDKWRQYFPWLVGDFSQLKQDLLGLSRGKLPIAGGRGLFSVIEGIGLLLLLAVGVSGAMWYATQGSSEALQWRGYHILLAQGFIGFVLVHIVCACLHLLDFIRN